jgi:hypothetical protein
MLPPNLLLVNMGNSAGTAHDSGGRLALLVPKQIASAAMLHYLEFFLTLLGRIINNSIWNLLIATGLFALTSVFKVVEIWLKLREEGDDEGSKGKLSQPHIKNALYSIILPIIHNIIQYDKSRSKSCDTWTPKAPG